MNAPPADKQLADLAAGNTELAERIAELDGKIATWIAAVKATETAHGGTAHVPGPAPASAPQPAAKAEPADAAPPPAETAPPQTAPAAQRSKSAATPPPEPKTPPPAEAVEAASPQTESAPPASQPGGGDDEEALLRTLDPETANAIRVKRRLTGDKRDVREMLAEVRAARQRAEEEKGKKRWWRRPG